MIALIGTTVVVIANVMAFIGVSVFSPHAALARGAAIADGEAKRRRHG